MNVPIWRRAISCAAIVLSGASARAQAPPASEVTWFQFPPGCEVSLHDFEWGPDEPPQILRCGGAASFAFGKPGLQYHGPCIPLGHATETPSLIPAEPAPRLPQEFPCPQNRCLERSPGQPWVAVLDWPTTHGVSVAATIREASDQRVDVQLYDLTAPGRLAQWVPSVSDLHVLAQLCAVEQDVQANPLDRPLAVNMSFGRLGAACTTSGPCSGAAVSFVLSHLAAEGILPVAAAGNDHVLLFPASSPDVVSAGGLDLSALQHSQEMKPSRQTPPAAEALVLGYGIYLRLAAGAVEPYWPAPPGSSYAAALFTGWLGGYLAGGGKLPEPHALEGAHWTPAATPAGLALALDGTPLPGSELSGPGLLFDRALGAVPVAPEPPVGATLRLDGFAPPLPELALVFADGGNGPQPGVNPCEACRGEGQPRGQAKGADTVVVDFSYSGGLPRPMELIAVFLRVGDEVYAFDRSRYDDLLGKIAGGGLQGLALTGVGGIFVPGEEPALVLVVNVGGPAYWHEIPIHMRW